MYFKMNKDNHVLSEGKIFKGIQDLHTIHITLN